MVGVTAFGDGWGALRLRGRGGGVSGRILNSPVNSYREGTEVVRALLNKVS